MNSPKRPRFGPGEIIVLMAIALIALVVITNNYRLIMDKLAEKLYSGASAVVALVMLVEYLLLKGADRSEIYLRELEAARQKRREDLLALREMETRLVELRARLEPAPGEANPPAAGGALDLRARIEEARGLVEAVLLHLRERI